MRSALGLLSVVLISLSIGYFTWVNVRRSTDSVELQVGTVSQQATAAVERNPEDTYTLAQGDREAVTLVGPMSTFLKGVKQVETIPPKYKTVASDHVGDSVVGTSDRVLHQTFAVAGAADVPFEIPAHAYSPQLHGTFQSFIQAGGAPTTAPGDVDFLLLSDTQYSALMQGQQSDIVFSADATHNQEVNLNLPPTLNQAARYHLIFRNISPKAGKRVVHAEFEMNF